jgi:tetratricopeptide (TPR) repeat protein
MHRPSPRNNLIIAALLMCLVIGLQAWIDPDRKQYAPIASGPDLENVGNQSKELLGGVLLGFREVAAGLLWVRADEYFHNGRYDDLVPLFYVVTWLDPHQLDVYSTGAWHLAYNLGDQRLIPEGVKFLDKGIRDNPDVYDLYFQQGWMHYNKVRDYKVAVDYFREAVKHKGTDNDPAPYYMWNQIAHGLEKDGKIDEMFKQWYENVLLTKHELLDALNKYGNAKVKAAVAAGQAQFLQPDDKLDLLTDPDIDALIRSNIELQNIKGALATQKITNLDTSILRREYFRKDAGKPGNKFDWEAKPFPRWVNIGDGKDYRTNTHFDYKVSKIGPRKLRITGHIEGMDFYNRLHGHRMFTRLDVLIRDQDYDQRYLAHANDFAWQKAHLTWYWKQVSFPTAGPSELKPGVDSEDFDFTLDLSKDPEDNGNDPKVLFPLETDQKLTITMDPTEQSPFHQDVFGWKGEGLTDDRYLVTDQRGVRLISKTVNIRRSDLL